MRVFTLAVFFVLLSPQTSQHAVQAQFVESFDIDPAQPTSWQSSRWDVTVHVRSRDNFYELEPVEADHGPDCGPPPAVHVVSSYEDAVYSCKNHMMTTLNAPGYGAIYLTPDHLLDFSEREAVLQFDMSTLRKSGRDWIDIWVTPFEDHLQLPLDNWLPDLQGVPRQGIHIRMDLQRTNSKFQAFLINNHEPVELTGTPEAWQGYEAFLIPDQRRRDRFELRLSRTHIQFGMPDYNFFWYDEALPGLDWSKAVVQLGHHSYNPTKDCDSDGTCGPGTWHWDNILMEPAEPFTMIHATKRYTDANTGGTLAFEAPSPVDAYLRFAGIGNAFEISSDGGVTWEAAIRQPQLEQVEGHFSSYFSPIPAGTIAIQVRATDWWGGPWHVRDVSIWALNEATSVSNEDLSDIPSGVFLGESYPNPAQSSITIPFHLASAAHVRIEIFDLTGRKIHQVTNRGFATGSHEVEASLEGLPTGILVYRLTTPKENKVRLFHVLP